MNLFFLSFIVLSIIFLEFFLDKTVHKNLKQVTNNVLILIFHTIVYIFIFSTIKKIVENIISNENFKYNLVLDSSGLQLFFNFFIYLLVNDFIFYWYHRFQHKNQIFWQTHHLHHSDRILNISTGFRTFWLDSIFGYFFTYAPLYLLFGLDVKAAFLMFLFKLFYGMLLHTHYKISYGWLDMFILSPLGHRIHHSTTENHIGKNFAGLFSFYDYLFGTYHKPNKNDTFNIGLIDENDKINPVNSLYYPIINWFNMIKNKFF